MDFLEFNREIIQKRKLKSVGKTFVDKTLHAIMDLWDNAIFRQRDDSHEGHLSLNKSSLKLVFSLSMVIGISFIHQMYDLMPMIFLSFSLILYSIMKKKFSLKDFFHGGFIFAVLFSLFLGAPALLNLFSHADGQIILPLFKMSNKVVGVTDEGFSSFILMTSRVLTSVAFILWAILSMTFSELIQVLRKLKVPPLFVQIISMTLIFLHILIKRTEEVHLAKKSRMICRESTYAGQKWVGVRIARAWEESYLMMEEVHLAMVARGFRSGK